MPRSWDAVSNLQQVTLPPQGWQLALGEIEDGSFEKWRTVAPAKTPPAHRPWIAKVAALEALDHTEHAAELTEIDDRAAGWRELRDLCAKALEAPSPDEQIADIDSAVAAIVSSGFKALSKVHHPDTGGRDATMALLRQARTQLRDLLELAVAGGVK